MLDALGISSYSIDECQELLTKLNRLKSKLDEEKGRALGILSFKFFIFGDTVIISVPIESDYAGDMTRLTLVCVQTHEIFEWGFRNKILFRGAIAIGDYLADDNFILGPAMFDVNTWCEVADWFGIIFTPKSRLWIESTMEKMDNSDFDELDKQGFKTMLVEYDVPLSRPINNEKTKNFLTYNWANSLFVTDLKRNQTYLQKFLELIYEIPMSKDGETKITNGVKYFKDAPKGISSE
jgi:hypothetical protein